MRPATMAALLAMHLSMPAHAARADTPADAADLKWAHTLSTPKERTPIQTAATPWPQLLSAASQQAALNRAADASVQAAQAQQQQAFATAWMPRLDASASSSSQKQTTNGSTIRTPTSAMSVTATVPVWRASDRATVDAQRALSEQAVWQAKSQRANVARDLSLAYVAAAEAAEQRRLAEAQQALLQSQLHINERRLQAGMGTVLDQLETRTRLDQVRASIQELSMRAATQRLTLERLSGQAVKLPSGFNPQTANVPHELPSLDEALQLAAHASPAWQDAKAEVNAAQATNSARDAEYWQPTVDASASASRTRQTQRFEGASDTQNTTTQAIGVQLNWPLFTGGYQQGRTHEAVALLTRSQARLDDAQSAVQTSLRDAYQSLTQAQAIIAAHQDAEASASSTHEAERKAFVAGMRTNIDLLNAQQQIYTARQNLVAARVTALTAQINILALLDQLDAQHVAPLTTQFDAEAMSEPKSEATTR